jgi:hypothetical protein
LLLGFLLGLLFCLGLGLRRIDGSLIKLALRCIFPDISARESLAGGRPLAVVEEGI